MYQYFHHVIDSLARGLLHVHGVCERVVRCRFGMFSDCLRNPSSWVETTASVFGQSEQSTLLSTKSRLKLVLVYYTIIYDTHTHNIVTALEQFFKVVREFCFCKVNKATFCSLCYPVPFALAMVQSFFLMAIARSGIWRYL